MCHYYESTEEWQALWVERAEVREAEQSESEPSESEPSETDLEDPDAEPAAPSVDV